MSKRKRKSVQNWRVIVIRGARAETVGTVPAPDANAAIKVAIKQYAINDPERQSRLAAHAVD